MMFSTSPPFFLRFAGRSLRSAVVVTLLTDAVLWEIGTDGTASYSVEIGTDGTSRGRYPEQSFFEVRRFIL